MADPAAISQLTAAIAALAAKIDQLTLASSSSSAAAVPAAAAPPVLTPFQEVVLGGGKLSSSSSRTTPAPTLAHHSQSANAAQIISQITKQSSSSNLESKEFPLDENDSPGHARSLSKDDLELDWITKRSIFINHENQVALNIGGTIFMTSITTLLRDRKNLFAAMFSGKFPVTQDSSGAYFVDRDPRHFRHILNFLRDGKQYFTHVKLSDEEISELMPEARFYQMYDLMYALKSYKSAKHAHKKAELTQEKEYRLFSDVPFTELQDLFKRMTINDSFDFEGWMKGASNRAHVLFSKKLSKGELALLDRLVSDG